MIPAEKQTENLARTVACPQCGARPGRRCRYAGLGPSRASNYAHTGRLKLARGGS